MLRFPRLPILLVVLALAAVATACADDDPGRFAVVEEHESQLDANWIAAGQPSEERVCALAKNNVRIISIRLADEDPYAEEALVTSVGGTFIRFEVDGSRYSDPAFRESLYDFIDAQRALPGQVYFHCKSSNRIGAAWALYNYERLGVDSQTAFELGQAAGLASLEPTVKEILGL